MKRSNSWKNHERYVATSLKGKRIPRGANFSRSLPDVVADSSLSLARSNGIIFAECKYSIKNHWVTAISNQYEGKLLYVDHKDKYILFDLDDIHLLADRTRYKRATPVKGKNVIPSYLISNMEQSREYINIVRNDPITELSIKAITSLDAKSPILPIVVLALKGKSFRLAYTTDKDLEIFYNLQNDKSYRQI